MKLRTYVEKTVCGPSTKFSIDQKKLIQVVLSKHQHLANIPLRQQQAIFSPVMKKGHEKPGSEAGCEDGMC